MQFSLRFLRAPYDARLLPVSALLLCLLAGACGRGSGTAYDLFSAYNTQGGAGRAHDYSTRSSTAATNVVPLTFGGLSGGLLGAPLELPGGTMAFVTRSDTLATLAVTQRDSVLWAYRFARDEHPMPGIAADSAGVLYVITTRGLLRAFSPEGRELWQRRTQPDTAGIIVIPSPLLALNDGVIFGNSLGQIICLSRSGQTLWSQQRGASASMAAAADPQIGLVIPLTHNSYEMSDTVLALDPGTGRTHWAQPLNGHRIIQGPAIVSGNIVLGLARVDTTNDRRIPALTALGHRGARIWNAPLPLMPRGIAADNEGNVYVACSGTGTETVGGAVVSYDGNGKRRWQVQLGSVVAAAPSVSTDWVYFVSRRDGRTGLFTYGRDGTFYNFLSIDIVPDVSAQTMISSAGELILAGLDLPVLLTAR